MGTRRKGIRIRGEMVDLYQEIRIFMRREREKIKRKIEKNKQKYCFVAKKT